MWQNFPHWRLNFLNCRYKTQYHRHPLVFLRGVSVGEGLWTFWSVLPKSENYLQIPVVLGHLKVLDPRLCQEFQVSHHVLSNQIFLANLLGLKQNTIISIIISSHIIALTPAIIFQKGNKMSAAMPRAHSSPAVVINSHLQKRLHLI